MFKKRTCPKVRLMFKKRTCPKVRLMFKKRFRPTGASWNQEAATLLKNHAL